MGFEIDGLGKPATYIISEGNLIERSGSVELSTFLEETFEQIRRETRYQAQVIIPLTCLNIRFSEESLHLLNHIAFRIASTKIIEALLNDILSRTAIRSNEEGYDIGIVAVGEPVDDIETDRVYGIASTELTLNSVDDTDIIQLADILMYAITVNVMNAGDDIHRGINFSRARALIGKARRYRRRNDLENEYHGEVLTQLIAERHSDREILLTTHVCVTNCHDLVLCSRVSNSIYSDGASCFWRIV
jgi:hypothetical protein